MIVILHNIRSLQNVGSIFRTADAVGVEKLYLGGITPTPINKYGFTNQRLIKTALGAEKHVKWEAITAPKQICNRIDRPYSKFVPEPKFFPKKPTLELIAKLKNQGFQIFAIEQAKTSIPYYKIKLTKSQLAKTCLIVGHEISVLPPLILKAADKIFEIPMRGQKESLNVSVAFGIVVFSLITQ